MQPLKYNSRKLDKAAETLRHGGLVVFPTETVYGLGAREDNISAIERIYEIKRRLSSKPLTVHIADVSSVYNYIDRVPEDFERLAEKFWPGPITLIIQTPRGKKGFRMPNQEVALELIRKAGGPIVAPSANISGENPPRSVQEIPSGILNEVDLVIDAGRTKIGIESTVLDLTFHPYKVLREGAIKKENLILWRK